MYIRPVHAELDLPTLHAFIRANPLGLFTTSIPHATHDTIQTSHIPFILHPEGDKGVLRGHMARANPQCKVLIDSVKPRTSFWGSTQSSPEGDRLADDILILFNAPTHAYVTPSFYSSTKPKTGKVVPTWNYAAVQVYGKCRIHHANTPTTSAYLQRVVTELTDQQESTKSGKKWAVADAPESYVDALKKGIIGLEVEVTRAEGRFKLSQEMGDGDWRGVVEGFRAMGTEWGDRMAEMTEKRGEGRGLSVEGGEVEPKPPLA